MTIDGFCVIHLEDNKRLQQHFARQYAAQHTPARALLKMVEDKVPKEHRPTTSQLKNMRPTKSSKTSSGVAVSCLGDLRKFVASPPGTIRIHQELVVCQEDNVCIPFSCPCLDDVLAQCPSTVFVMDFTYKVSAEGLLLGVIGPAALRVTDSLPVLRCIPAFFVVSTAENEASHKVLLDLYMKSMESKDLHATDGFFDCSCMAAVLSYLKEHKASVFPHRCLQHVKRNIRDESSTRDIVSGRPRLQNRELVNVLLDWVQFSAFLPSDLEFGTFWSSIISRMDKKEKDTDFNEPEMSAYLKRHILDTSGAWW